jgi:hypothetical protein
MLVVLILSIVTISFAGESSNQLCNSGSQPPMIQDCKRTEYQELLSDILRQTEELLKKKEKEMENILILIDKKNKYPRLTAAFPLLQAYKKAQKAWHTYSNAMLDYRFQIIIRTHNVDSSIKQGEERQCMMQDYRFNMLRSHLSFLDGEMRFLCQFYSQTIMQQKTEGKRGKTDSELRKIKSFNVKKKN